MKGDDAVGCLVADALSDLEGVEVIDAGVAPENYIEPVVKLNPDRVLIVDACAFGGEPGEFRLFPRAEIDQLAGSMVSTHTLPLSITVAMLGQRISGEIHLLGIQPGGMAKCEWRSANPEFGNRESGCGIALESVLSEPVAQALPAIVSLARKWAGA